MRPTKGRLNFEDAPRPLREAHLWFLIPSRRFRQHRLNPHQAIDFQQSQALFQHRPRLIQRRALRCLIDFGPGYRIWAGRFGFGRVVGQLWNRYKAIC